uniref:Uncharacterized protein n=1 Tax=Meloidogyne enterolobii TaxID=390850 RepID=A0A6V7WU20_MELEN|nr:unnamed protein product [Meloidogyne enterolobii]
MYLFQLFILFLHSIPNCSTPPYPYPISLLYGWYNEAFLHGNIGKNGIKVLDWHYSEYLGDINSSNEKMTKIAIVTQTILFNESSTLYATNLIRISHLLFWLHYRFVSHYNSMWYIASKTKVERFFSFKW